MTDLVSQAFDLVLYGMGSVFIFLTALVGATMLMSRLLGEDPLESAAAHPAVSESAANNTQGGIEPDVLAAITAAVKQYRANH